MKRLNYFLFIISSLFIMSCNMNVDSAASGSSSSSSSSNSSTTNASSTAASGATSLTYEVTDYNTSLSATNSTNGLPSFIYTWSNSYTANTATRDLITEKSPSDLTFANTLYLNLSDLTVSSDDSDYSEITSEGTVTGNITTSLSDTGLITISDSSGKGNNLKLLLSGSASGKSLFVSANKNNSVEICLNSVTLTSGNYPCIEMDKKNPVYLVAEGTNSFTDGRSYGTNYDSETNESSSKKGTIYTKGGLIMSGSGSISVTEGYKHGFYSKDYIQVNSGTYTVKSTGRNGFQAANAFVMNDGTITISGSGSHTNNQSRGIIVEGWDYDTDDAEANSNIGEGYIVINGGSITSTTVSKGISAKWDIDEDAGTSDTSDDPYPFVLITGGTISITTTGTPQDESSSYYTFTDADGESVSEKTKLSPEGIEGKQALFITGGIVEVTTTDDCLNVSRDTSGYKGKVEIYGGNIFAYSSGNDAIDSNGTLTIAGGIIVALTSTTPECAFDCDSNTFAITGGLLVGIGTNNYSAPTSSACSQSTVVLSGNYFGSGNTTFAIEDSSANPVFAYTIPELFGTSPNSSYIMILSSPEIQTGTSYKAVSGVSASGGTTFHNLYVELPEVSSGSTSVSGISTSSSSYVYTKSSSTNNGAGEGMHPNIGF